MHHSQVIHPGIIIHPFIVRIEVTLKKRIALIFNYWVQFTPKPIQLNQNE